MRMTLRFGRQTRSPRSPVPVGPSVILS